MLKKFLHGLMFGAGFGISLIIIWYIGFFIVAPIILEKKIGYIGNESELMTEAPSFSQKSRFLGSTGCYSSDFNLDRKNILSSGPGVIRGRIFLNGNPHQGVKIRLGLNGKVLSQWSVSNELGEYIIKVPYGKYRIDGYELDPSVADTVLKGKIDHPQNPHSGSIQYVDKENEGIGLNLKFVDPVVKKTKKKYLSNSDIVLEWVPYPNAFKYSIQLFEKDNPNTWKSEPVFPCTQLPTVSEPRINLATLGVKLKPNHYYFLQVYAKDKNDSLLSVSHRDYNGYDFAIKNK